MRQTDPHLKHLGRFGSLRAEGRDFHSRNGSAARCACGGQRLRRRELRSWPVLAGDIMVRYPYSPVMSKDQQREMHVPAAGEGERCCVHRPRPVCSASACGFVSWPLPGRPRTLATVRFRLVL